ncbi:hypothetical protein PR048_009801, partial [Dryococelus australis]
MRMMCVVLCLSAHSTQALQRLNGAFFGPLKLNTTSMPIASECIATVINRFKATAIYPFCPAAIPEYFFQFQIRFSKSLTLHLTAQDTQ